MVYWKAQWSQEVSFRALGKSLSAVSLEFSVCEKVCSAPVAGMKTVGQVCGKMSMSA